MPSPRQTAFVSGSGIKKRAAQLFLHTDLHSCFPHKGTDPVKIRQHHRKPILLVSTGQIPQHNPTAPAQVKKAFRRAAGQPYSHISGVTLFQPPHALSPAFQFSFSCFHASPIRNSPLFPLHHTKFLIQEIPVRRSSAKLHALNLSVDFHGIAVIVHDV